MSFLDDGSLRDWENNLRFRSHECIYQFHPARVPFLLFPPEFRDLPLRKKGAVAKALVELANRQQPPRPMRYHWSGIFMVLPAALRWEFLRRNPAVQVLLKDLQEAIDISEQIFLQWGATKPHLPLNNPVCGAWTDFDESFEAEMARRAEVTLIHLFPLEPGPCLFDPLYGIPGSMNVVPGPSDLELYPNLWTGLIAYAFPDLSWERWIAEPAVGQMIFSKVERLIRKYPATHWQHLAKFGQREVRHTVMQLRSNLGLPNYRQSQESYYFEVLKTWDEREGWTGEHYEPEHSSMKRLSLNPKAKERYYRAFELITGLPYSDTTWQTIFGALWQANSILQTKATRRRAGRKNRQAFDVNTTHTDKGEQPAHLSRYRSADSPDADPSKIAENRETDQAIELLTDLVRRGFEFDDALALVYLPEDLHARLTDSANRPQINSWIEDVRSE